MRHQAIDQLRSQAQIEEAASLASREARLRRWAELLRQVGSQPLKPLMWVEFYGERERKQLRRDDSPISVAYADTALRNAGLRGDTLGDAQAFFGLSDRQAHELLCDCHYAGTMTGRTVSSRIRAAARPGLLGALLQSLQRL